MILKGNILEFTWIIKENHCKTLVKEQIHLQLQQI